MRVIHGLCRVDVVREAERAARAAEIPVLLNTFAREEDSVRLGPQFYHAKPDLVLSASRRARTLSGYTPPPYYFIGVVRNSDQQLRKLQFFPVYYDENHLVFVDSDLERRVVDGLLAERRLFLKPSRLEELTMIACDNPDLKWLHEIEWRYLPDFVIWGSCGRKVVELRGFERGTIPAYDQHLDFKRAAHASNCTIYKYEEWSRANVEALPTAPPADSVLPPTQIVAT